MSVIFILIACSLVLAGGFLGAFLWASRAGQFEDSYTPSVRILYEDEESVPSTSKRVNQKKQNSRKSKT